MRWVLSFIAFSSLSACDGDVRIEEGETEDETETESAPYCTPGASAPCKCNFGATEGTSFCRADGSGYGPCEGACACGSGRNDGCCFGDGFCCSCVPGCNPSDYAVREQLIDQFIACVCGPGVCAAECAGQCAGDYGTSVECAICAKQAETNPCQMQHQMCAGR